MCSSLLFVSAQQEISSLQDIMTQIEQQKNHNEALIQWYYAIEDLHQAVAKQAPNSPFIKKIALLSTELRTKIDEKKSLRPLSRSSLEFVDTYRDRVLTKSKPLDRPCPQFRTLVDDRAFALDLPTSLVTATWLMENGC